jgi:hypothetical protein
VVPLSYEIKRVLRSVVNWGSVLWACTAGGGEQVEPCQGQGVSGRLLGEVYRLWVGCEVPAAADGIRSPTVLGLKDRGAVRWRRVQPSRGRSVLISAAVRGGWWLWRAACPGRGCGFGELVLAAAGE